MLKLNIPELEKQAESLVNDAKVPVTVDYIARQLHIAWDTARSLLLSLAVQGRVSAVKTMKSWIFQPTPEKKRKARLVGEEKEGSRYG